MHFLKLVPMLQAQDMNRAIKWCRDVLGFELRDHIGNGWCCVGRDDVSIMFTNNAHLGRSAATAIQYIYPGDVMALCHEIRDRVTAERGPETFDYGRTEFAIRVPNHTLLSFRRPAL